MSMTRIARSMSLVALLAVTGGCTAVKRVDMDPTTLRGELRAGGVVQTGDKVTVISEAQGDLKFVVTDVDGEVIRGESELGEPIEVPINEIVALETRKFAPVRTGAAIWGGTFLVGMAVMSVAFLAALLF